MVINEIYNNLAKLEQEQGEALGKLPLLGLIDTEWVFAWCYVMDKNQYETNEIL